MTETGSCLGAPLQRRLLPEEALLLQGFPVHDPLLSAALCGLSMRDVMIGAGNAMSVPSVAAVIAEVLTKTYIGSSARWRR